jgi:adenylosuccinate synthase
MSKIHVVTGAMFGSEGKGHVTAQLINNPTFKQTSDRALNIRVAGPNAGHTVLDKKGIAYPLRTIPVAAAVDHDATLYISPGSEIELDVLLSEVELLRSNGHPVKKLYISGEATLLEDKHKQTETQLDMHNKLGSTGKGIGAARADRIMRTADRIQDNAEAVAVLEAVGAKILNARESLEFIAKWTDAPDTIIVIEGTQGYGLGLHAGHYPQCTSSDTRAIDFLAMAGISPWSPGIDGIGIWLVARVYPIRVAGNSGPLKGETTWEELGLPIEKTTVTHKVRRVGEWDAELIRDAVVANGGATYKRPQGFYNGTVEVLVALTMADQKIPGIKDAITWGELNDKDSKDLDDLIRSVEKDAGIPVGIVTTGPAAAIVVW